MILCSQKHRSWCAFPTLCRCTQPLEADSLNAFLGIARYLQGPNQPIHHLWGIPIIVKGITKRIPSSYTPAVHAHQSDSSLSRNEVANNNSFVTALSWYHAHPYIYLSLSDAENSGEDNNICDRSSADDEEAPRRIPNLPSWSWIGWRGKVSSTYGWDLRYCKSHLIDVKVETNDGSLSEPD